MTSRQRLDFEGIIDRVQHCAVCSEMDGCTRVLSWANGSPDAEIMFVGEAPGRLGADRTAIPFHGDVSGDNFERLLQLARLPRREIFVTNAVLCNPRDDKGNNTVPSHRIVRNCAGNLKDQIEFIRPKVVVTLGAVALSATKIIESHNLSLATSVRTATDWFGTTLIPLYHPGARAMIHRNFSAQTADYYFVGETLRRIGRKKSPAARISKSSSSSWDIVRYIVSRKRNTSLFSLHKIMYLLDWYSIQESGSRLSDFVYIRQKDGPYCVELGSRWFRAFDREIGTYSFEGKPHVRWIDSGLFASVPSFSRDLMEFCEKVLDGIDLLSDRELKSRAYLTDPMKISLRAERAGLSQLNRPLL